jgi:hypothetical protein
MDEKKQIDYKEYARQMRENCPKDHNGNVICSGELWEEIANTIENLAGYRKQEWISVEDRLPEECKNVLCFARNKTIIAFMEKTEDCGKYVPVFWDWVAYDRDDTYDEVCAIHWMPLPEAPKMKGGAE